MPLEVHLGNDAGAGAEIEHVVLGAQDVQITRGTLAWQLADNKDSIHERFRHRYEVEPAYIERLEAGGLIFSGRHPQQPIMQVLELPTQAQSADGVAPEDPITHPYFVAAQFHPELTSRPLNPQPVFMGLVASAIRHRFAENESRWDEIQRRVPGIRRWLPYEPNGPRAATS